MIDNYRPDYDYNQSSLRPGEYEAVIEHVIETRSQNGNEMLKISLPIYGKSFFYYIVDNEHANKNLTKFFQCFNIQPGNWDFNSWRGHRGQVFIDKKKDSTYFEIKYLIVPENSPQQPPANPHGYQQPPQTGYQANGHQPSPMSNADWYDQHNQRGGSPPPNSPPRSQYTAQARGGYQQGGNQQPPRNNNLDDIPF
jgi:hypothetical protein